jgi:hypothetical protein
LFPPVDVEDSGVFRDLAARGMAFFSRKTGFLGNELFPNGKWAIDGWVLGDLNVIVRTGRAHVFIIGGEGERSRVLDFTQGGCQNSHVYIRMIIIASSVPEIYRQRFLLKHANLQRLDVMGGAQRQQEARVSCHNGSGFGLGSLLGGRRFGFPVANRWEGLGIRN